MGEISEVDRITAWISANLGATVTSITLVPGWRPAWLVTASGPEGERRLYVRGDRPANLQTLPLRNEYEVLRLLARHGIPVPVIYGWCEDPETIIMEAVDTLPFHGGAHLDPALHAVVSDYIAIMARIHRIDVTEAEAFGFTRPTTPETLAFAYFKDNHDHYLAHKTKPEPLIEFVRKWVLANIPQHRSETALVIGDAPQFFHDGTRVTHVYDLELAHIGDPMADLASVRVRDINEPIGRMTELLLRYVAESGKPIDWAALDFHTIAAFLSVPMRVGSLVYGNEPVPAYIEYLSWYLGGARAALEVLADVRGVALAPVALVDAGPSRNAVTFDNLDMACLELPAASGRLREPEILSLAHYARRLDEAGAEMDRVDLTETEALVGEKFANLDAADAALEGFVLAAGPEQDSALVTLFYRRTMRRLQLIRDYPGPIVDRGPTPIDRSRFA